MRIFFLKSQLFQSFKLWKSLIDYAYISLPFGGGISLSFILAVSIHSSITTSTFAKAC